MRPRQRVGLLIGDPGIVHQTQPACTVTQPALLSGRARDGTPLSKEMSRTGSTKLDSGTDDRWRFGGEKWGSAA